MGKRKRNKIGYIQASTLTEEEVLQIHYALVDEFISTNNPIDPPGVKSRSLLGSAVSRQHVGIGGMLKYPDAIHNAATLAFGLCCDHPFHNGNKRTALVSLLVHLDKNHVSLAGTPDAELFELMLKIAKHEVVPDRPKRPQNYPGADEEVAAIAKWLKDRAKSLNRGERLITYKQLRRILVRFNYELDDPYGNFIQIYKVVEEKPLFRSPKRVRRRVGSVGYPRESVLVSIENIKHVRKICKLREEDGIDSDAFYDNGATIDTFINQHRRILQRLANR
jgi:death-on-curing protein